MDVAIYLRLGTIVLCNSRLLWSLLNTVHFYHPSPAQCLVLNARNLKLEPFGLVTQEQKKVTLYETALMDFFVLQ
jgi:hypothetical protein